MSNIIPPMVSSSPPPMDDNLDDDEDDDFGDYTSANLSYGIGGDDEDENYVEYGTALEPLDEDAPVQKKPHSVATDSHGRRRFHGAFTGGFSAGFFNTVGSLEGWTPSSFKSSRAERAGVKAQRPEDFMDDEDMGEFGIAPSVLRARSDFADERQKRKRGFATPSEGPIPGKPVLEDLLRPVRETVGIKLLRRMGWRPGQGIGPRLSKVEKKRSKREQKKSAGRIYGCSLPGDLPSDDGDSSDGEDMKNITFAPDDCQQMLCKAKDDVFGIGYSGLDKRPVLSGHINLFEPSRLVMNEKGKKVSFSGQAFGVGALGDDDDDIYAREDMTQYDFSLDEPSPSQKPKSRSRFSQDDRLSGILEGFVRGCTISSNKRYFPPPELPPGFEPVHVIRKARFEPDLNRQGQKLAVVTALDRAAILREPCDVPVSLGPSKEPSESGLKVAENLSPLPAEGTGCFKPFVNNPDKQRRYEQYTTLIRVGQKDKLASLQPLDMTEWERERERTEFEQASKLFTPLSGPMSDRFVTAVQPDDTTNPLAPVENLVDENSDRRNAVKMKMFGRLTRERTSWQPCSLLLKRFNIAEPTVSDLPPAASARKPAQFSVFDYLDASALNKPKTEIKSVDTPVEIEADSEVKMEPAESTEEADEITFPDPPEKIDLYKAIFLSSSDESEADEDDEEEEEEKKEEENVVHGGVEQEVERPPERNLSPPRGVFANLDLDAINVRKSVHAIVPPPEVAIEEKPMNGEVNKVNDSMPSEEDLNVYGPRLPVCPPTQTPVPVAPTVVLSSVVVPQGEWVEKRKKHKSKHHKREHKKSSKHKSKKSKRKR